MKPTKINPDAKIGSTEVVSVVTLGNLSTVKVDTTLPVEVVTTSYSVEMINAKIGEIQANLDYWNSLKAQLPVK